MNKKSITELYSKKGSIGTKGINMMIEKLNTIVGKRFTTVDDIKSYIINLFSDYDLSKMCIGEVKCPDFDEGDYLIDANLHEDGTGNTDFELYCIYTRQNKIYITDWDFM